MSPWGHSAFTTLGAYCKPVVKACAVFMTELDVYDAPDVLELL